MDIRIYFEKVREIENAISSPFVVVSSLETVDGGKRGRLTLVSRLRRRNLSLTAKPQLATDEEHGSSSERARTGSVERRASDCRELRFQFVSSERARSRSRSSALEGLMSYGAVYGWTDRTRSRPASRMRSSVLDTASTEGIDLAAKLSLAQREIGFEIGAFLMRHGVALSAGQKLDRGNCDGAALALALSAYARADLSRRIQQPVNDRYQGKWREYGHLSASDGSAAEYRCRRDQ